MKYDVFISYSRLDSDIVDQIFDCLENNNITAFIDRENLSGGEEFTPVLAENIEESTIFLFVGSENSYKSDWVKDELYYAFKHKEKNSIIPYLIDNEELPRDIDIKIGRLNIRNINDHPFDSTLIDDIKIAIDKICPKDVKEDVAMAKAIADRIAASSHSVEDKYQMLIELGDVNWDKGLLVSNSLDRIKRPHEAEIYYKKAESLHGKFDKEICNDYSNSFETKIYENLGKIYKSFEKWELAENYYQKLLDSFQLEDCLYYNDYIDCMLDLCEIRFKLEKYDRIEDMFYNILSIISNNDIIGFPIGEEMQRLSDIMIKTLHIHGKDDRAEIVQDEILTVFRNLKTDRSVLLGNILTEFANNSILAKRLDKAVEYFEEARSLDKTDIIIGIDLAKCYANTGRKEDAISLYNELFLGVIEGNFRLRAFESILFGMTRCYDERGDYKSVDNYYNLAIAKCKLP